MNYWLAILVPPLIIIFLNIILKVKYHNKVKAIIYGLLNSSFQIIGYAFALMSYDKGIEKYSYWAPLNLLTLFIPITIILILVSVWIRIKK
jgi:hypothetical protein